MDRQKMLDNFVGAVNGKGRASTYRGCEYFPNNGHPGCAIGCQPGFREAFEAQNLSPRSSIQSLCGVSLINDRELVPTKHIVQRMENIRRFFGVENLEDVRFLAELQALHDDRTNWKETNEYFLKASSVVRFCNEWDLKFPEALDQ